jgi:hypothetical protein
MFFNPPPVVWIAQFQKVIRIRIGIDLHDILTKYRSKKCEGARLLRNRVDSPILTELQAVDHDDENSMDESCRVISYFFLLSFIDAWIRTIRFRVKRYRPAILPSISSSFPVSGKSTVTFSERRTNPFACGSSMIPNSKFPRAPVVIASFPRPSIPANEFTPNQIKSKETKENKAE